MKLPWATRIGGSTGEGKLGAEHSSRAGGSNDCTNKEQGCRAASLGQHQVQKQESDHSPQ